MKILYSVGVPENKYCVIDARAWNLGFAVHKKYPDGGFGFIANFDSLSTAKDVANIRAAEKPLFNYRLLRTAIILAGGIPRVAKASGMKQDALRQSLKNKREFTHQEMENLRTVLLIPASKITAFFFTPA